MFMPTIGFGYGIGMPFGCSPFGYLGGCYGLGMGMLGAPFFANPFGSLYGGYAGSLIGSGLFGLLGMGLGSSYGPMGMMGGAMLGSMLGGGLGWGLGSYFGGYGLF
ncbi:MAG TPA: hypothetical protein VNO81_00375 [Candidatus Nitrosotenuis sp.]|jgi:hypothetical protein|nr:hypothetical protein [Candidatus Nitrosotenuis sp.]